jgi:hypothetical protein
MNKWIQEKTASDGHPGGIRSTDPKQTSDKELHFLINQTNAKLCKIALFVAGTVCLFHLYTGSSAQH